MISSTKNKKIKHADGGICMKDGCEKKQREHSHYCCTEHNVQQNNTYQNRQMTTGTTRELKSKKAKK